MLRPLLEKVLIARRIMMHLELFVAAAELAPIIGQPDCGSPDLPPVLGLEVLLICHMLQCSKTHEKSIK